MPLRQDCSVTVTDHARFIYSAAKSLQLSENDCRALLDELCGNLPKRLNAHRPEGRGVGGARTPFGAFSKKPGPAEREFGVPANLAGNLFAC